MSAPARRREFDPPYSLGERLWLAWCAHPRSVPLLTWAALVVLALAAVAVAS